MKYKLYLTLMSAMLFYYGLNAQPDPSRLYEPRDIKEVYQKGTHLPNGQPGANYWENHGRYDITVEINPPDRTVRGKEEITYFNNSPDTLQSLTIKLLNNVHKAGAVRLRPADSLFFTSGIHIDTFKINDEIHEWRQLRFANTFNIVRLEEALLPHDSIHLYFEWHYQVSLRSGREGMIDSTTFYIAYFYPRVAVYDDYEGWDRTEFNQALEFYNDFNDYNLYVKVPENFVVWSTGTLQNASDVLQPEMARRLDESMRTDKVVHVATKQDWESKDITSRNPVNTWHWKADYVPDVAFGISDHYDWDATSVVVDDATGRRASAQAAYCDTAADFHYMAGFARHALDWLSHNWPGVPYPFPKSTVFQGHADMEYPMMVNDGAESDTVTSKWIAEHEIAHSYMPFYMGINETRYGFMDEGWATTFELLIGRADRGRKTADSAYERFRIARWTHSTSGDQDLEIMIPGTNLSTGLGINEYGKPSLGYLAMKDLLGDAMFKKCLQAYMQRWHGKHPIPWDFFYTFNDVSGQNLNWFWNNWFFSRNYIDMAVKNVTQSRTGYDVSIQNVGGMDAPFDLVLNYADGSSEIEHQTPALWKTTMAEATVKVDTKKKLQSVKIDGGIFMDASESDNSWTMK